MVLRHDRAAFEVLSKKHWSLSTHKSSAVICFLFVYAYMCVCQLFCNTARWCMEKYCMLSNTIRSLYTHTDENMDSGCSARCEIHPAENIITEMSSVLPWNVFLKTVKCLGEKERYRDWASISASPEDWWDSRQSQPTRPEARRELPIRVLGVKRDERDPEIDPIPLCGMPMCVYPQPYLRYGTLIHTETGKHICVPLTLHAPIFPATYVMKSVKLVLAIIHRTSLAPF